MKVYTAYVLAGVMCVLYWELGHNVTQYTRYDMQVIVCTRVFHAFRIKLVLFERLEFSNVLFEIESVIQSKKMSCKVHQYIKFVRDI